MRGGSTRVGWRERAGQRPPAPGAAEVEPVEMRDPRVRTIADLNRQTAADFVTERRHNRVVVWPAPLPKHIWEPVNI